MNLPISRHHRFLGLALGLALTFVLLAGIVGLVTVLAPAAGSELLGAIPPQAAVTPTVSGETQCAKLYPLDGRGSAAAQQAQQKRYDACVQAYNTRLTPKPALPLQLTLEAPRTIFAPTAVVPRTPAGAGTILESGASPLSSMYVIENSWISEANGRKYLVFSGAEREEGPPQPRSTMQGIVVVWVSTLSGQGLHEGGYFSTPVEKGPVRIVGAQGQRLILQADDGTTFYFDVASYRFVSSLTEVVPTATVPATPTGLPNPGP
jgi:hypothetical protein